MPIPAVARLLVDIDHLAVAGVLAARSASTEELVIATGRDRRTVLESLGELRSSGLVTMSGDHYQLAVDVLRSAGAELTELDVPMDPIIGFGMTDDERLILGRYFSGRVLDEIPITRVKRLIVLERLVLEFDIGRRYTESEVNEMLFPFHTDVSSLRRHLVDEGLLDREHVDGVNTYWRIGGRVTSTPTH